MIKLRNNPTPAQRAQRYWPRLTLNVSPAKGGGLQYRLRVEFACPKVLFGNNFDELVDIQFGDLVRSLAEKMGLMGVRVTPEDLSQSLVSAVHYSKNVMLTDFARCTMVLQELAKLNLLLELVQNAGKLFHSASVEQKRKILKLLYWNLELTDGKLGYALRKLFDLFLETAKTKKWLGLIDTIRTDYYQDVIALVPQMPSVRSGLLMAA